MTPARRLLLLLPLLTVLPIAVRANEPLRVANVEARPGGYYSVVAETPKPGRTITCTLRDASGNSLSRNSWVSATPVTVVPVHHPQKDVASAVCASN